MKYLKQAWKAWKKFGRILGNIQGLIIFTIFYFLILWIVGITSAFFSDVLRMKNKNNTSGFTSWEHNDTSLAAAQNPY